MQLTFDLDHSVSARCQTRGTILFVDDEELLRDLGKIYLERAGYLVLLAETAADAFELLQAHEGPLDLLATDVNLPGTTGPMLARALGEIFPHLQLIYMSGYPRYSVGPQASPSSEVGFLQKPFALDDLVTLVSRLLDARD